MKFETRRRMEELDIRIEDLISRLPAHSVKPRMIWELEELEEELDRLKNECR